MGCERLALKAISLLLEVRVSDGVLVREAVFWACFFGAGVFGETHGACSNDTVFFATFGIRSLRWIKQL